MQPTKPPEDLYDLRWDPHELRNVSNDPAYAPVLREMRAELGKWRKSVGDPGVTPEIRTSGRSSKYPTRPLAEWQRILSEWENHILQGGPMPKIIAPSDFTDGEGMVRTKENGRKKQP